jgi:hypothetical protein
LDKFSFHHLVENPLLVKADQVKSLQKLVDTYPYFQTGKMMLCIAQKKAGHLNYENTLQTVSLGSNNRKQLFQFVNEYIETLPISPSPVELPISTSYQAHHDELLKSIEENLIALKQQLNKAVGLPEEEGLENIPLVNADKQILPFEEIKPKAPKTPEQTPKSRKQLPLSLIHSFVEKEASTDIELNPFQPYVQASEFFDYKEYKQIQKEQKSNTLSDAKQKIEDLKADFQHLPSSSAHIESSVLGDSIENKEEANSILHYLEQTQKAKKGTISREKTESIMNKFIFHEPQIRKPNLSPDALPEKDLTASHLSHFNTPISENYAILLVKQGKISKAIEVYEKLMLKYPEKKAYFTQKINELNHNY